MIDINWFLEKYYQKGEPIILACSTGPDSMFLLYEIIKTPYKNNLVACYFNHKLREEADQEEVFLEELWKKEWFKVEVASCDIKKIRDSLYPSISLEELAREKRYMFFWAICEIYNTKKLMTWHHLDDKIETFLFNLSRWSKLTGLINMTENYWNILRPLLNLEKNDILKYLDENNLKYNIDKTNFDNDITRNHLRNEIIPKFYKLNSKFKQNIWETLKYFEDLKSYIDNDVNNFLENKNYFEIDKFNNLWDFLKKEIIREIFYKTNNNSTIWLTSSNILEIIKFVNWKNNKTIKEIKNLKMKKDWNKIYF